MTTSANSIEHAIYKREKNVGNFSKNIMCSKPDYAELLKYQPLKDHTIRVWGYDEEEDMWEDEPENLENFLKSMVNTNRRIREFFKGIKTFDQIMQEMEEERKEESRKMHEYFEKKREKIRNELKNDKT